MIANKSRRRQDPQEWALVVYWDMTKSGKKVESESCVPIKWLSENHKTLWWPTSVNVRDKIDSLPNCSDWIPLQIIKIKFTGTKEQCEETFEDGFTTSSESEQARTSPVLATSKSSAKGFVLPTPPKDSVVFPKTPAPTPTTTPTQSGEETADDSPNNSSRLSVRKSSSRDRSPISSSAKDSNRSPQGDTIRQRDRSPVPNLDRDFDRSPRRNVFRQREKSPIRNALSNTNFPMDNARFQKRTLKLLLKILDAVENRSHPETHDNHPIEQLDTEENFDNLDASLHDKETFSSLVKQLKSIGGKHVNIATKNAMERLMSYNIMALFNMNGKSRKGVIEKRGFSQTEVCAAVIAAVKMHINDSNEEEIKRAVANNLKYAPDKQGGGGRKSTNS